MTCISMKSIFCCVNGHDQKLHLHFLSARQLAMIRLDPLGANRTLGLRVSRVPSLLDDEDDDDDVGMDGVFILRERSAVSMSQRNRVTSRVFFMVPHF